MRTALIFATVILLGVTAQSSAHHKPGHHMPPGQMKKVYDPKAAIPNEAEYVCVVTTERSDDPYSPVVFTEWLSKKEAIRRSENGRGFIIIHPDVNYREGCAGF